MEPSAGARAAAGPALAPPPLASAPAPVPLLGLGTALPAQVVSTAELVAELTEIWPHLRRRRGLLLRGVGTGQRAFCRAVTEMGTPLTLAVQTRRYAAEGLELAAAAAERALADASCSAAAVDVLIVASCTGFILPGLDARLVPRLGLRPTVRRVPVSQLGCAGGAAALALAAAAARGHPAPVVLVVAVELPSLTFRPQDACDDNVLGALVFGDGAGAAVLGPPAAVAGTDGDLEPAAARLLIERTQEALIPESGDALGYELDDDGFRVVLARDLPERLGRVLPAVVDTFLGGRGPGPGDVVALHPGGPGILAAVRQALALLPAQLAASADTFTRTGNTSSAGIFFVLQACCADPPPRGTRGLALGFGPGLTVELLALRWPG